MPEPEKQVVLTGEMTYAEALAFIAGAWPHLPVLIYRPTIEHYKEGRPTEEELELGQGDRLCGVHGRQAVLRGGMTGQGLHHAVMTAFGTETSVRGTGIRGIWRMTLDEAENRVERGEVL